MLRSVIPLAQRDPVRDDLAASVRDGMCFSVMAGLGESFVPAFALALGLGDVWAGLVATVPILIGALLQTASLRGVAWVGSLRRWVVLCAVLQAAAFLPLVAGALAGTFPAWALLLAMALYWGAGQATGPAWNAWIETLVPRRLRAPFFAQRSRLCQGVLLVALVGGGTFLEGAAGAGVGLLGFAALFAAAFCARCASATYLWRHREPVHFAPEPLGARRLAAAVARGPASALLGLMVAMQFAVFLSAPYFTPYMLRQLDLSYGAFAALTATAFGARILALPLLGRVAKRYGPRQLLVLGAAGIAPLAALWNVSDAFLYLFVLQVASGVAWGSYELATFLLFFETIPRAERLAVLTAYNLLNALALVGGALLGGLLLEGQGGERAAYALLFVISTGARFAALLFVARVPERRAPALILATRPLAARPSAGAIERPIVSSIELEEEPADP